MTKKLLIILCGILLFIGCSLLRGRVSNESIQKVSEIKVTSSPKAVPISTPKATPTCTPTRIPKKYPKNTKYVIANAPVYDTNNTSVMQVKEEIKVGSIVYELKVTSNDYSYIRYSNNKKGYLWKRLLRPYQDTDECNKELQAWVRSSRMEEEIQKELDIIEAKRKRKERERYIKRQQAEKKRQLKQDRKNGKIVGDTDGKVLDIFLKYTRDLYFEFLKRGWKIEVTTNDIATTYTSKYKYGTACGVTIPSEGKIYIEKSPRKYRWCVLHEFGHYIDAADGYTFISSEKEWKKIYRKEKDLFKITDYKQFDNHHKSTPCEYFAEAFQEYCYHPKILKKHTPMTYRYMKKLLDRIDNYGISCR